MLDYISANQKKEEEEEEEKEEKTSPALSLKRVNALFVCLCMCVFRDLSIYTVFFFNLIIKRSAVLLRFLYFKSNFVRSLMYIVDITLQSIFNSILCI